MKTNEFSPDSVRLKTVSDLLGDPGLGFRRVAMPAEPDRDQRGGPRAPDLSAIETIESLQLARRSRSGKGCTRSAAGFRAQNSDWKEPALPS